MSAYCIVSYVIAFFAVVVWVASGRFGKLESTERDAALVALLFGFAFAPLVFVLAVGLCVLASPILIGLACRKHAATLAKGLQSAAKWLEKELDEGAMRGEHERPLPPPPPPPPPPRK